MRDAGTGRGATCVSAPIGVPRELSIIWPLHPGPTAAQELRIKDILVAKGDRPGRMKDMPQRRRQQITDAGASIGLTPAATVSLRKRLIAAFNKRLFYASNQYRDEAAERAHATRVEQLLLQYMRGCGAVCISEGMQRAAVGADGTLTSTPDVLFQPPIRINGELVNWIECKCWYASSSVVGEKRQFSLDGACKQIGKYTAKFGQGAVFFLHGFSSEILPRLHAAGMVDQGSSVLFLDGTPLDPEKVQALFTV